MAETFDATSVLHWWQKAFNNFRVVPPGTGICHQRNLELLAQAVFSFMVADAPDVLYRDN